MKGCVIGVSVLAGSFEGVRFLFERRYGLRRLKRRIDKRGVTVARSK